MPTIFKTTMTKTEIQFSDESQQSRASHQVGRNRLINGQMRIAQRGPVAVALNTLTFGGCDRWPVQATGFTTFSGTVQQAGTASLYVQELANVTTTGSGVINFIQRIEALNIRDVGRGFITLQVELYQDTGATISPVLYLYKPRYNPSSGAWDDWTTPILIASTTVSLPSGVRTKFTWTYELDVGSSSSDPIRTDAGLGITISFPVGAVTGKYFQISNCQLEKGIYPTAIETIPITVEETRCQRYYNVVSVGTRNYGTTADIASSIKWQQYMRAIPTVTKIRAGTLISNATTSTIDAISQVGARHIVNVSATGSAGISDEILAADAEIK